MVSTVTPSTGDIIILNLDPIIGHEQGGIRPNVVVSVPTKQRSGSSDFDLVITVPLTRSRRNYWTVVPIKRQTGLDYDSYALCHNIRTVSTERITNTTGTIDPRVLTKIRVVLKDVLSIL